MGILFCIVIRIFAVCFLLHHNPVQKRSLPGIFRRHAVVDKRQLLKDILPVVLRPVSCRGNRLLYCQILQPLRLTLRCFDAPLNLRHQSQGIDHTLRIFFQGQVNRHQGLILLINLQRILQQQFFRLIPHGLILIPQFLGIPNFFLFLSNLCLLSGNGRLQLFLILQFFGTQRTVRRTASVLRIPLSLQFKELLVQICLLRPKLA